MYAIPTRTTLIGTCTVICSSLNTAVHTVLFLQKSSVSVPASFSPITVTFSWNRPIYLLGAMGEEVADLS